jgi:hypothetical protein
MGWEGLPCRDRTDEYESVCWSYLLLIESLFIKFHSLANGLQDRELYP